MTTRVPLLSGAIISIESQASAYTNYFAVSITGQDNCTFLCNGDVDSHDCNSGGAYTQDACVNFGNDILVSPSGVTTAAFTIQGLSYNSDTHTYNTMPSGSTITIGSYVGFATSIPKGTLQTGQQGNDEGKFNNVVQISPYSWEYNNGASFRAWVIVGPAPVNSNSEAGSVGYFNYSSPQSGNLTGQTVAYYGQQYYVQSVGQWLSSKATYYWIVGSQGGYACCGSNLYCYHIENGQMPSSNMSDFSFVFLSTAGQIPGQCLTDCSVSGQTCNRETGACYTPGTCVPDCNTAAGWICSSSNTCVPNVTPICIPSCSAAYTCVFTSDGATGEVGATCQLLRPCDGNCSAGQTCSNGVCISINSYNHTWVWVILGILGIFFLIGIIVVVMFLVVRSKKS